MDVRKYLLSDEAPAPRWLRLLMTMLGIWAALAYHDYGNRNEVPRARAEGYAAAVDSVRAVERKTDVIRILDAYGASYTVLTFNAAGRETSMVHVGGAK